MRLTLDGGAATLADIDLGEASDAGYFEGGDLGSTAGNLYIRLDGVEYGSLFFFRETDGRVTVTLGAFDAASQDWVERKTLDGPANV